MEAYGMGEKKEVEDTGNYSHCTFDKADDP